MSFSWNKLPNGAALATQSELSLGANVAPQVIESIAKETGVGLKNLQADYVDHENQKTNEDFAAVDMQTLLVGGFFTLRASYFGLSQMPVFAATVIVPDHSHSFGPVNFAYHLPVQGRGRVDRNGSIDANDALNQPRNESNVVRNEHD